MAFYFCHFIYSVKISCKNGRRKAIPFIDIPAKFLYLAIMEQLQKKRIILIL